MNVEYASCKISSVRWLHEEHLRNSSSLEEGPSSLAARFWMCGTYNWTTPRINSLSIWTNLNQSSDDPERGIFKVTRLQYAVDSSVYNIVNYDRRSVLVSLASGDILWLKFSREAGFELIFKLDNNTDLNNHQTTGLLVNDHKEAISCGTDGKLNFIDLNTRTITKSAALTSNSLHCLDKISPDEVIVGTTSGHLKLYDKRSNRVELTMENEMAVVTAVARNSHIPHIVASANDLGYLQLWDTRKGGRRVMQPASAHSAAINCLRYSDEQSNLLLTSSYDGQLIKWNISADFEIQSVDAIVDRSNTYPINCFDLNAHNQLVFADDNEVLYLTSL